MRKKQNTPKTIFKVCGTLQSGCKREIVLLLFLRHRYVPAQDPIEQTLTSRDDAVAKKIERENEKHSEREKKYEKERVERNARKKRDRRRGNERKETINNTGGKTEKRMRTEREINSES
jgi:hypothetical protein